MSFTGGKLKLKGGDIGKRKKKKKSKDAGEGAPTGALVALEGTEGVVAAVQKVRAQPPWLMALDLLQTAYCSTGLPACHRAVGSTRSWLTAPNPFILGCWPSPGTVIVCLQLTASHSSTVPSLVTALVLSECCHSKVCCLVTELIYSLPWHHVTNIDLPSPSAGPRPAGSKACAAGDRLVLRADSRQRLLQLPPGKSIAYAACTLCQETEEGFVLAPPPETADRRTAAEKRHDEKMASREGEKTRKMAMKSHRERVNDFNAALEQLSEHHDIPRVRGGSAPGRRGWPQLSLHLALCTCCVLR